MLGELLGNFAMINVVIPVLDEAHVIESSALRVRSVLEQTGKDFSVCIVDNGSTDDTYRIARRLALKHDSVITKQLCERGKARAIRAGWHDANGEVLCFVDADLSPDICALPEMISCAEETKGLVISSRHLPSSETTRNWFRSFRSVSYNALLHVLTGSNVSDHQCGLKCVHASFWSTIADDVGSTEWFLDTELVLHAYRRGRSIDEYAITWADTSGTETSAMSTVKMLGSLYAYYNRFGFASQDVKINRHSNPAMDS